MSAAPPTTQQDSSRLSEILLPALVGLVGAVSPAFGRGAQIGSNLYGSIQDRKMEKRRMQDVLAEKSRLESKEETKRQAAAAAYADVVSQVKEKQNIFPDAAGEKYDYLDSPEFGIDSEYGNSARLSEKLAGSGDLQGASRNFDSASALRNSQLYPDPLRSQRLELDAERAEISARSAEASAKLAEARAREAGRGESYTLSSGQDRYEDGKLVASGREDPAEASARAEKKVAADERELQQVEAKLTKLKGLVPEHDATQQTVNLDNMKDENGKWIEGATTGVPTREPFRSGEVAALVQRRNELLRNLGREDEVRGETSSAPAAKSSGTPAPAKNSPRATGTKKPKTYEEYMAESEGKS